MSILEVILKFFKIIISIPGVILFSILLFKKDIKNILEKAKEAGYLKIGNNGIEIKEKNIQKLENEEKTINENIIKNNEIKKWKFQFFNLFLVFNSKNVLLWFRKNKEKSINKDFYINNCNILIQNELKFSEKIKILNVLKKLNLLEDIENNIKITEEGEEFLKSINY